MSFRREIHVFLLSFRYYRNRLTLSCLGLFPLSSSSSSSLPSSALFTDLPLNYTSMRKNSLGLDSMREDNDETFQFTPSSSLSNSPPLVPFSFPIRATEPSSSCPPSPPLIALSMPNFSSNTSSPSATLPSPVRPQRPVAHPLTSKLRLEMTPLPAFELPLPDVEMSPPVLPWTTLARPSDEDFFRPTSFAASLNQGRKNSLVELPIGPPTPPLTPNDEIPPFDWERKLPGAFAGDELTRGRSHEVTPIAKVSLSLSC